MASEKLCLKDYLMCDDDKKLSKTRKKVNAKSHKKRVYGLNHGYTPSSDMGGDGGGLGESLIKEMHDGALPNSFTPNIMSRIPNSDQGNPDMKKENRRQAPRRRSFAEFMDQRHRAEEEEITDEMDMWKAAFATDDEPENDFERFEQNQERGDEIDDFMSSAHDEEPDFEFDSYENEEDFDEDPEDPEEFDDFDEEKELEFDDDDEMSDSPLTGTFVDFFRGDEQDDEEMDDPDIDVEIDINVEDDLDDLDFEEDDFEEEEEPTGPGGFEPGQANVGATPGGSQRTPKIDRARMLFQQLVNRPDMSRGTMIEEFIKQLDVTDSTAVSYYERIAKEMGMTGSDNEDQMQEPTGMGDKDLEGPVDQLPGNTDLELSQDELDSQEPDRQGIIRTVNNAHMVYKRQMEDGGFEELWVYNIADDVKDSMNIRREILSGTDIPRGHTRSEDGQQSYSLNTMGNAQLLHITGLNN